MGLGGPRARRAQEAQGRRAADGDEGGVRKARAACAQRSSERTARMVPERLEFFVCRSSGLLFQVDVLSLRYKYVNFGAERDP